MKKKLVTKPALEAGKLRKTTTISLSETDMYLLDELVELWGTKNRSAAIRLLLDLVRKVKEKKRRRARGTP